MSQTIRQLMADMLAREELSALDLAGALLLTAREVEEHLAHLKSSHKGRLRMLPVQVPALWLRIADRRRLDTPRAAAHAAATNWWGAQVSPAGLSPIRALQRFPRLNV